MIISRDTHSVEKPGEVNAVYKMSICGCKTVVIPTIIKKCDKIRYDTLMQARWGKLGKSATDKRSGAVVGRAADDATREKLPGQLK